MSMSKIVKRAVLGFAISVFAIGASRAQTPESPGSSAAVPAQAPASPAPAAPVDSSYLLGTGDVVEIGLVGRADFGSRARVSTDGTILLPLIGRIHAADRTVLELSDDVRQALIKGGFYGDPIVRADVIGISSRYVTVMGQVGSPGLLPLDRNYRLSEILAKVGGRAGNGASYVLLTPAGSASKRYSIEKLGSASGDDDPVVKAGDKIFIPTGETEVFYISGEIKSPGAFAVTDKLTFRMAIARGGGVTENGSEGKLKVIRDGKPIRGVKLEDFVKVGDIITVGERLF